MLMSQDQVRPSPLWFAVLSVLYLVFIAVAVVRNWEHMATMTPNEWGDVAAGVFSPLAFLWFLYTALAQRAELRLQHEELRQNTAAQRDQEQQMQRQADALHAQTERLRAQAAAQYAPILVLRTSAAAGNNGDVMLQITNYGERILDVTSDQSRIFETNGEAPARSNRIPHWPRNVDFRFVIGPAAAPPAGPAEDRVFEITLTRLDLQTFRHSYRYINADQRIELLGVEPRASRRTLMAG